MSSVTRRQVLASGAIAGLTASLPLTAQARIGDTFRQSCPYCSANLAMGDLHRADCEAAREAPPLDDEINPEAKKPAGKAYAQEPSGCGARGYDTKSGKPRKEEPGCGARGYDLKSGKQSR
jgi:hypothetical protein